MTEYDVLEAPYVFASKYWKKDRVCDVSQIKTAYNSSFYLQTNQSVPFYFLFLIACYICTKPLPQKMHYLTLSSVWVRQTRRLGSPLCHKRGIIWHYPVSGWDRHDILEAHFATKEALSDIIHCLGETDTTSWKPTLPQKRHYLTLSNVWVRQTRRLGSPLCLRILKLVEPRSSYTQLSIVVQSSNKQT